jgi:hypothetical protein
MKPLHAIPNEIQKPKTPKRLPQALFWHHLPHEDCEGDSYWARANCARRYLAGGTRARIIECDCWRCDDTHAYIWNRRYTCNDCRNGRHPRPIENIIQVFP